MVKMAAEPKIQIISIADGAADPPNLESRNYLPIARATLIRLSSSSNQTVAKKTKVTQTDVTADSTSSFSEAKIDKAKPHRASTASKTKKPLAKKAARNQKTKSTKSIASTIEPTDEEIRLRAYFISERRRRFDLPGDASSDWLEARRQLLSEIGRR